MRFTTFLPFLGLSSAAFIPNEFSSSLVEKSTEPKVFDNVTIFTPPVTWTDRRTWYARTLLLNQNCEKDNVLLATFTVSPPGDAYMPIYRSTNGGHSWSLFSKITFKSAPTGGVWQPFLYQLSEKFGKYPAGTVLATGNAVPSNFSSTNIEVHASTDEGRTFHYVSTVAVGTGPDTTNGAKPIWEPFIMAHQGKLGVFYSDQRDPKHGQKLCHQESKDLVHWGPIINDAAYANYTLRPGMTSIAKMGNGKFIFFYELALGLVDPINAPYAVYYRIADSPFKFDKAKPLLLKSRDGTIASAGPQTVWTPAGGPKGTVVVSDSSYSELFINREYGDPKAWLKVESGKGVGYTRGLQIQPHTQGKVILVANGGMYGQANTTVTVGEWVVPGPGSPKDTISSCHKPNPPKPSPPKPNPPKHQPKPSPPKHNPPKPNPPKPHYV